MLSTHTRRSSTTRPTSVVPMPLSLSLRWERVKIASLAAEGPARPPPATGRSRCGAAQKAHHLIHCDGTGDLPCRRAAHAVANNIDSVLDGEAECIFVGRTFAAAIANRGSRVIDYSRGQARISHQPVYTGVANPMRREEPPVSGLSDSRRRAAAARQADRKPESRRR